MSTAKAETRKSTRAVKPDTAANTSGVTSTEEPVVEVVTKKEEPIIDAASILRGASPLPQQKDEFEEEVHSDPIPDASMIEETIVEVPKVRKIAIKKISRFNNRLGLERIKDENLNLMPGVSHVFCPDKKGDEFLTGLEDKPEIRKRLEGKLRVSLDNKSDYYANLTFELEDKKHGQILNFDDPQFGAFSEVVYYAMLASSLVANGLHEYDNGTKALAEWYIENKEAEAEARSVIMRYEQLAYKAFDECSISKVKEIGQMLGLPVWTLNEKAASVEVWNHIKKNANNAKDFYNMAIMDQTKFNVSVLTKSAIKHNVIRKNRLGEYAFVDEVLGPTEDHVVSRLSLASSNALRTAISNQLKAKGVK